MIKYSTWRAHLISELEATPADRRDTKKIGDNYSKQFPQLAYSDDRKQFYEFMSQLTQANYDKHYKDHYRNDNISHFICRMLYCQEETTQITFI